MILKTKPSAIRENKVFTLDMCEISIQSAKADDNGAYISKGSAKKFYAYDEWSRTTHKNENEVWYVNMKSSKGKTEKMQKKQRESKSTTVVGGKQFSEPEKMIASLHSTSHEKHHIYQGPLYHFECSSKHVTRRL